MFYAVTLIILGPVIALSKSFKHVFLQEVMFPFLVM